MNELKDKIDKILSEPSKTEWQRRRKYHRIFLKLAEEIDKFWNNWDDIYKP